MLGKLIIAFVIAHGIGVAAERMEQPPRATRPSVKLTSSGDPGETYSVSVHVASTVCTTTKAVRVDVNESFGIAGSGYEPQKNLRRYTLNDGPGCLPLMVRWRLPDAFYGIGTYSIQVRPRNQFGFGRPQTWSQYYGE